MGYEMLLIEAENDDIIVQEKNMSETDFCGLSGKLGDLQLVWIRNDLSQLAKRCTLAEEIGHIKTSSNDILDMKRTISRKQEKRARNWGYEKLVPLEKLVEASIIKIKGCYSLAEYLGVPENYLQEAINHYRQKHGLFVKVGKYELWFEPHLGVRIPFDEETGSFK